MMTEDAFNQAIDELASLNGISPDLAGELMARIGDTPDIDEEGYVSVPDDAGTLHRVKYPMPEEDDDSEDSE